jgi:hypothetical protein
MQASVQHYPSLAGWLAENLLKAWLSADTAKIQTELERSITAPLKAHDTGEQERRQLLHAVANRMRNRPDLLGPGSETPEMNLYAHLLFSLSVGDKIRN